MLGSGSSNLTGSRIVSIDFHDTVLMVNHFLDCIPDFDLSEFPFSVSEKEKILQAAAHQRQSYLAYYTPRFLSNNPYESDFDKAIASLEIETINENNQPIRKLLCADASFTAEIKKIISDLVRSADLFYLYFDSRDVDNRIKYATHFLQKMDALVNILGAEKFKQYLKSIEHCHDDDCFLRVILLAYIELRRHANIIKQFARAEYICHEVIYKIAHEEGKFNTLIMQGAEHLEKYAIQEIIVNLPDGTRDQALKAAIILPIYDDDKVPAEPAIEIAWAGTCNNATTNANFQVNPGEISYRCGEYEIMKQIIAAIKTFSDRYQRPVRINVSGHSLGAAYAQLCTESLNRVIARSVEDAELRSQVSKYEDEFERELLARVPEYQEMSSLLSHNHLMLEHQAIAAVSVSIWNSTGVLTAVTNSYNRIAPFLKNKIAVPQYAYIGMVFADPVQATGDSMIWDKLENNGIVVHVLKIVTPTMGKGATAVGISGSSLFTTSLGIALIGTGIGLTAGAAVGMAGLAYAFRKRVEAHTMKHFLSDFVSLEQMIKVPYRLFSSHHIFGGHNMSETVGIPKINAQLHDKSLILNSIPKVVNATSSAVYTTATAMYTGAQYMGRVVGSLSAYLRWRNTAATEVEVKPENEVGQDSSSIHAP